MDVLERKPKWAIYYAEKAFHRDLVKAGILKTFQAGDFLIEYIEESSRLVEFLKSKNESQYPYRGVRF